MSNASERNRGKEPGRKSSRSKDMSEALREKVKKCLEDYYETSSMPERCDAVQKELYDFLKSYAANYKHESK